VPPEIIVLRIKSASVAPGNPGIDPRILSIRRAGLIKTSGPRKLHQTLMIVTVFALLG